LGGAVIDSISAITAVGLTRSIGQQTGAYPRLTNVEVAAGHVEIVGYKGVAPRQLISILQQQGLLASTAAEREAAFKLLIVELYLY